MRDATKLIALGRGVPAISKSEVRVYSSVGEGLLVFTVSIQLSYAYIELNLLVGTSEDYTLWVDV